jgi:hypothetical protein
MNLRGFYKATGVCALIYAAVSLLILRAVDFSQRICRGDLDLAQPGSSLGPAADEWKPISVRLDGFSYFFLIPAGVGLFAYLRERNQRLP